MRTLQEKYNGINEGTFTKEQFLRDARLQLPTLITQYNGYDDAVQILKNRGMISEVVQEDQTPKHKVVAQWMGPDFYLAKKRETDWDEKDHELYNRLKNMVSTTGKAPDVGQRRQFKEGITQDVQDGTKLKNTLSGAFYTVDGKDETGGIYVRSEKGLRKNIPSKYFDAYKIVEEISEDNNLNAPSFEQWKNIATKNPETFKSQLSKVGVDSEMPFSVAFQRLNDKQKQQVYTNVVNNKLDKVVTSKLQETRQPKLTKKALTDYRYKPTNDLDKYPYEQILRGLRVELEGMQVTGTPTAEDYKKALAKVLKNLQKDEIFYTNQIAGGSKKVDNHDQMVAIQGKEKEIKNSVDTFNGLKKAQLKEGFKNLIKKVLTENADPLHDYYESKENKKSLSEAPAKNNPKIEKLVNGINQLISQAVEDGEPVGVIWPGGTWDEPYIYQPIVYKNGQLKVTSKSVYGGAPQTETVLSKDMEMDGIPMLRTLMRMYKKAVKKLGSNVQEGTEPGEKTINLEQLHKIAMKAGNFGSDVKDALLNLYMGYGDKVPTSVIKKVLAKYDLTFADLKDQPATFKPSSEFAHLFNIDLLKELGYDATGASNATGEYEVMMHMLDAGITNRSEASKFFALNYSDMPEQQIEFLTNHYFEEFQEEEKDSQVDEEYSRVLDLPDGEYFAIDDGWEDEYKGHNGLFFTVDSGEIYDKDGEAFQVSPREFISQFKPEEILKVEELFN